MAGTRDLGIRGVVDHRSKQYRDYLASPEWAWRKDRAFEAKRPARCYCCNRKASLRCPLDLHHLTYERFWREPSEDLVLVCRVCHTAIHHVATNGCSVRQATETVRAWRRNRIKPDWMKGLRQARTPRSRRLIKEQRLVRGQAKWAEFKARVAAEAHAREVR